MSITGETWVGLASRRIDWLAQGQRIVAENVANADTPGFEARRAEGFDALLARGAQGPLLRTSARHIGGLEGDSRVRAEIDAGAWDRSLDGNTVVLEQQAIQAGEIDAGYRLAANLYRKGHEFVRLAASSNG